MKGVGSDELRPSRRVSERVSEFERFTAAFSSLVGDDSLLPPWSEEPLRSGFGVTFGVASGDSFEPRFDPAPGDGEQPAGRVCRSGTRHASGLRHACCAAPQDAVRAAHG